MDVINIPDSMLLNTHSGAFATAHAGPTVVREFPDAGSVEIVTEVSSVVTQIATTGHVYGGESVSIVYCTTDFMRKEVKLKCSRGKCAAAAQKQKWVANGKNVESCKHVKAAWALTDMEFESVKLSLVVGNASS